MRWDEGWSDFDKHWIQTGKKVIRNTFTYNMVEPFATNEIDEIVKWLIKLIPTPKLCKWKRIECIWHIQKAFTLILGYFHCSFISQLIAFSHSVDLAFYIVFQLHSSYLFLSKYPCCRCFHTDMANKSTQIIQQSNEHWIYSQFVVDAFPWQ